MEETSLLDLVKNIKDFGNGVLDTTFKVPYSIGDFIARATGVRDAQLNTGDYYQLQAKNEINGLLVALGNKETAKVMGGILYNEMKEKPFYLLGGFFVAGGLKDALSDVYAKAVIPTAKLDAIANDMINQDGFKDVYDLFDELGRTGEFDVLGNTWNKILDFYGNYDDVVDYYADTPFSKILDDTADYFGAWGNLFGELGESLGEWIDYICPHNG